MILLSLIDGLIVLALRLLSIPFLMVAWAGNGIWNRVRRSQL